VRLVDKHRLTIDEIVSGWRSFGAYYLEVLKTFAWDFYEHWGLDLVSTLLLSIISVSVKYGGGTTALRASRETIEIFVLWVLVLAAIHFIRASWLMHIGRGWKPKSLHNRALDMAHDLYAFLREVGPEPPAPLTNMRTSDVAWDYIKKQYLPYAEVIHSGYLKRFKHKVVELFSDLSEDQVGDREIEQWDIDPPQSMTPDKLKKVASHLILIAARIDIAEQSKGI
jgi:hypothetical protein